MPSEVYCAIPNNLTVLEPSVKPWLLKQTTHVISPCGCLYRVHPDDRSWYCAKTGPYDRPHDWKFFRRLRGVDPIRISAGFAMHAMGIGR